MAQQTTTSMIEQAWLLLQQDKPAEALTLAQQVLARQPGNIAAIACRAVARWGVMGENPQSLTELRKAIDMAPAVASLRHNYATLLGQAGRVDEAAKQYAEALKLRPTDTRAFWGLSHNSRMRDKALFGAMEALYADPAVSGLERQFLAYGLAKASDDLGLPEKAIAYATEGNRMINRPSNAPLMEATLRELRGLVEQDAFRKVRKSGHPSRAPVFIVGMPRSGTTLIETILSRHPDVLALGESSQIGDSTIAALQFRAPGRIDVSVGLSRDWLKSRAEKLARDWSTRRPKFSLVTDKMPDNAFSLGLISQLFPNARVIYARRHPLDVGVSNFLMRFAKGQGFSTRLDWIGLRSRQVAEAMELWKRGTDLPILDVHYERLVADPETEIRRIVDFVGLDWTEDFLTPEQSDRSVRTASQWQVRQPIYKTSVARWKRYEPWLGPMIEAMGGFEWIDAQTAELDK